MLLWQRSRRFVLIWVIRRWLHRCLRWLATKQLPTFWLASAIARSPRRSRTISRVNTASPRLRKKVLGEGGKPVDCRIEDQKRTGQEFEDAKKALGDLARSEEDIMSYICYPDQTVKFLENRKAQEENEAVYTIEAM